MKPCGCGSSKGFLSGAGSSMANEGEKKQEDNW